MARLKITETVLREGNQCFDGSIMKITDIIPVLSELDKVGFYSLEVFGGRTFEDSLRYLREDPWQRLRRIKAGVHSTKLQMVCSGRQLMGNTTHSDDVVSYFFQKCIDNGIDIVRVYDPMNNPANLECAIRTVKKEGATVQAGICYIDSPQFLTDIFLPFAKQLKNMGADSVCLIDNAGILPPYETYQMIKALRSTDFGYKVQLHAHCNLATATASLLKAAEAGVDAADTCISPFALGSSLPPTESIVYALNHTPYETELDLERLFNVGSYFGELKMKYRKDGFYSIAEPGADLLTMKYGIPAFIHRNVAGLLTMHGEESRKLLPDILREIKRIQGELGYPALVAPLANVIAVQATQNILDGKRYRTVTPDFACLLQGKQGKTVLPVAHTLEELSRSLPSYSQETVRSIEYFKGAVAPFAEQEEDLLSLALFPETAREFFEWRKRMRFRLEKSSSGSRSVHPTI
ncbi:MAG: pyruvate carboxylase subunit B [Clostridia bacterium]|nr:pyruvate carboxylase subunit B [Clostridia bacterium]